MEGNGSGRCAGDRLTRAKREAEDRVRRGGAARRCSRWLLLGGGGSSCAERWRPVVARGRWGAEVGRGGEMARPLLEGEQLDMAAGGEPVVAASWPSDRRRKTRGGARASVRERKGEG
jgi:hypothetical protein